MVKEICVVTEYFNNGENWGDNYDSEKPIDYFLTEDEAIEFCSSDGTVNYVGDYSDYIKSYTQHKHIEYFECPVGKDWRNCDSVCDNEMCNDCWEVNNYAEYDNSWIEYRIYKLIK